MADSQQSNLPPVRRYGGESIETMAIAPLLGDGYAYDQGTLEELARLYDHLGENYRLDRTRAQLMAQTQAPGLDFSSVDNAALFRSSGRALLDSLIQCEQFCRSQAAKYRDTLRRYTSAEDSHSSEIHNTGGSL
ncbi:hypothetical protein [Amycolatopsis sp. NPDC004079]|uniref:hypothetical protein n=1 Tax=Amycolatopsis sp. NPDC004079 TaxID=3154549 RepID=UPI0033BD0416